MLLLLQEGSDLTGGAFCTAVSVSQGCVALAALTVIICVAPLMTVCVHAIHKALHIVAE